MTFIREAAKRAGVSPATVSHVINQTRIIAKEASRRVHAVMQDCGYYLDESLMVAGEYNPEKGFTAVLRYPDREQRLLPYGQENNSQARVSSGLPVSRAESTCGFQVVEFDDLERSSCTLPALTTSQPGASAGRTAPDLLVKRISDSARLEERVILNNTRFVRDSCRRSR